MFKRSICCIKFKNFALYVHKFGENVLITRSRDAFILLKKKTQLIKLKNKGKVTVFEITALIIYIVNSLLL
jgi:hypothetical protein